MPVGKVDAWFWFWLWFHVLTSVNSEVKCNSTNVSKKDHHIAQTQEEADMKIIVLVKHWRLNVFKNAVIKTIDTDATTFY